MRRGKFLLLLILLAGMVGFLFTVRGDWRTYVVEHVTGETPEAKVRAFAHALAAGDESRALQLWQVPVSLPEETRAALVARQKRTVERLLRAETEGHVDILDVEWWGTCCEPRPISSPKDAGGARMRVRLHTREGPTVYIFDVFVRDGPYWGAVMNYPPRHWVIRDVYPEGEAPLYWRFR